MLMDNSSVGRSKESPSQVENIVEQNLNNFEAAQANSGETEKTNAVDARANDNAETRRMRGEILNLFAGNAKEEQQIGEVDEKAQAPELPGVEKLQEIKIPRDAKVIPSSYAATAKNLIDSALSKQKDPSSAVEYLRASKRIYLKGAFDRVIGENQK